MTAIGYIIALTISSTVISIMMLACAIMMPRLRYWPLFWAVGLIAVIVTAVLALVMSKFGLSVSQFNLATLETHDAFGMIDWPAISTLDMKTVSVMTDGSLVPKIIFFTYGLGLTISILRLALGRYRAVKIVQSSDKFVLEDGTIIGLTKAPVACMTVTSFARPRKPLIVFGISFYGELTALERNHIIRHETGHIIRRDDEVGLLLRFIVALSWFNPLSHLMFHRWMMSAEMQCDQKVTIGQSPQMRRAYAKTLLKALHIPANRVRQYPAASLSTHRIRNEKMRIKNIMQGSTPIFKHVAPKLFLLATAAGLSLTGGAFMSTSAVAQTPRQTETADIKTSQPDIILAADTSQQSNIFIIEGTLSSPYGPTKSPFKKGVTRNHHGVDFKAPSGTPVYAPADGVITEATALFNNNANYGKVVVLQTEGGLQTMMAHLDSYDVEIGQAVLKGQKLAEIGSTGKSTAPHVHIETRRNGRRVDPMSVWHFNK